MSKPVREVEIKTAEGKRSTVDAVVDSGSFYSIIREDCLPRNVNVLKLKHRKMFGTARKGGKLPVTGQIVLDIRLEGRWIEGEVLVAPALGSDMLIGAGLMQMWDISIKNKNGHTQIHVGRDMSDPDIQTVL